MLLKFNEFLCVFLNFLRISKDIFFYRFYFERYYLKFSLLALFL